MTDETNKDLRLAKLSPKQLEHLIDVIDEELKDKNLMHDDEDYYFLLLDTRFKANCFYRQHTNSYYRKRKQ